MLARVPSLPHKSLQRYQRSTLVKSSPGDNPMTKHLLAGAAAFAMMTGVAFAQSMSSDTSTSIQSTTTTTTAPAAGSYNSYETHRSTDTNGDTSATSKTYQSGPAGSKATSDSQMTGPDGSQRASHEIETKSMDGGSTMSKQTSTTTIER